MQHNRFLLSLLLLVGLMVVGGMLWRTWMGVNASCELLNIPREVIYHSPVKKESLIPLPPPALISKGSSPTRLESQVVTPIPKHSEESLSAKMANARKASDAATPQIPTSFLDSVETQVPAEDQSIVAWIAKEFSETMTQVRESPSSPTYHKAWKEGVKRADEELKQQLGTDLYNKLQFTSTNSQ